MRLEIEDFDIAVGHEAKRRRDYPAPGWYWQEVTIRPRGPFATVGDALRDLTAEIESGALLVAVKARLAEFEARRAERG